MMRGLMKEAEYYRERERERERQRERERHVQIYIYTYIHIHTSIYIYIQIARRLPWKLANAALIHSEPHITCQVKKSETN